LQFDRPSPLDELAERGRRIFHAGGDPRVSKDGRACASCHPDGRDDGLVWSTPNGPRQTISLAARVRHEAPFGWMAKHASLPEHMRTTMKNLKGKGLEPRDEDALASYLVAMRGPPVGARPLSAEEEQGRAIFESTSAECSSCHGGPDKSDHDAHDVKTRTASDTTHDFLAPSLAGIGGSAPYFHDGRYTSLEELLDKSDGKMGSVAGLSPGEKGALVAYLRTL
jgi:cytochrome c peroxidase